MAVVLWTLAAAGLLSFLFVGLITTHARRTGRIDRPGKRSSHLAPTPTGAGLGMILALSLVMLIVAVVSATSETIMRTNSLLLGTALVLSLVGYRDDAVGVSAGFRLTLQLVVSVALCVFLGKTGLIWLLCLALLLTWTMNAFNFMDGSDGMAGVQGVFSSVLLAWAFMRVPGQESMVVLTAGVTGVCVGFLPWNLPSARVFMGDAGSVPLGWLLGGIAVVGAAAGVIAWPIVLLVLAPFHVDAGLTLLGRVWRGEQWYNAHRKHVYQRLIAQGWSHGQVLLAYTGLNLLIVVPAALLGMHHADWAWWLTALTFGLLVAGWCVVSLKLGKRP